MVASKASIVEVIKDLVPLPKPEDSSVLVASPFNPSQQNHVQLRVSQCVFQALPFFGFVQQFHQGGFSHRHPPLHVIPGKESLPDF